MQKVTMDSNLTDASSQTLKQILDSILFQPERTCKHNFDQTMTALRAHFCFNDTLRLIWILKKHGAKCDCDILESVNDRMTNDLITFALVHPIGRKKNEDTTAGKRANVKTTGGTPRLRLV